jgi:endonuclease/exonuclease/phosphatase family metal-dependent hydrolase
VNTADRGAAAAFTLMSYNIFLGGTGRMDAITEIVRTVNPDLLGIQEADDEEAIARMATDLGMEFAHGKANTIHHVALLSRFPIIRVVNHPHPGILRKTMLEVHVRLPNGAPLTLYVAHLNAFATYAGERRRVREVEAILGSIAPHAQEPHLLFGDCNALAPGDPIVLERVTAHFANRFTRAEMGRIRPRRPLTVGSLLDRAISLGWLEAERILPRYAVRHVLAAGYTDSYRRLHPYEPGFTFPAPDPALRLDYVFAPPLMQGRLLSCEVVDLPATALASDHRPLVARFAIVP